MRESGWKRTGKQYGTGDYNADHYRHGVSGRICDWILHGGGEEMVNELMMTEEPAEGGIRKTTKDGKEKESVRTCGYFGDIRRAIREYLILTQLDVMDGERLKMQEYAELVDRSNKLAVQGLESVLGGYPVK